MTLQIPLDSIVGFLLASMRVGMVLYLIPTFGGDGAGRLPRIILAFLLGTILAPPVQIPWPDHGLELVLFAMRELAIGAMLGLLVRTLLFAPLLGGDMVAQDMGLRLAQEVDPTTRIPSTAMGRLYEVVLLLVFLALHGHHDILRAVSMSFTSFPVGDVTWPDRWTLLIAATGKMMQHAVMIAAPMMAVLFLGSLMLALMGKAVPQLQVFSFGLQLRMAGALLLVGILFPLAVRSGSEVFVTLRRSLFEMVGA